MKTTRALFLMIAWTTLLGGAGYAAQADNTEHQEGTKSSDRRTGHRKVSGKNPTHRTPSAGKPNRRAQPLPNKRERPANGNGVTTGQTARNETSGPGNGPRAVMPPISAAHAVHPPNLSGPFGQSPPNGRHRGANSATVGGTAKSVVRNTGTVSGTGASHRR